MSATTIDEVIHQLEEIISASIQNKNPLGIFAALYQKVTIAVKQGIQTGRFENAQRMEKLDVIFANRYLAAYQLYQSHKRPSQSWWVAFKATEQNDYILLQHLLLGINAHINLDLGIAAAQTMKDENLHNIEPDFMMINTILSELMEEVQDAISKVSFLFFLVDWIGGMKDEKFAAFSLKASRVHAWNVAKQFHKIAPKDFEKQLNQLDKAVAQFAALLKYQGFFKRSIIRLVHFFETKDIGKMVSVLHGPPKVISNP